MSDALRYVHGTLTERSLVVKPLGEAKGGKVLDRIEEGCGRDQKLPVSEVTL